MGDKVEAYVGGRTYWVYGLEGLGEDIDDERSRMAGLISDRVCAAEDALEAWRGPHAERFAEWVDEVLHDMVAFKSALQQASRRCRSFPDEPASAPSEDSDEYTDAQVRVPDDDRDVVSAHPPALDDYVDVADQQDGKYAGMATEVNVDDLSAEVAEPRSLTADERAELAEDWPEGLEHELDMTTTLTDPEDCPVDEVFGLPDLSDQADTLKCDSAALAVWVAAVARAFEDGNQEKLDLLLEHPELAGFFDDDPETEGQAEGDAALAVLADFLAGPDSPAGMGGDEPLTLADLETLAGLGESPDTYPEHVQAAADYLLENRLLTSQVSMVSGPDAYELNPETVEFTVEDIGVFLDYNESLRALSLNFDELPSEDGHVSAETLREVADSSDYPDDLREAAQFLVDNPELSQRIELYESANLHRAPLGLNYDDMDPPLFPDHGNPDTHVGDELVGFSYEGLVALAVDQHAFAADPSAARQFVEQLPVADEFGNPGLSVHLTSDEGVKALANAALADADLVTEQHSVISHLPETVAWEGGQRGVVEQHGGVRNELITGFYDLLSERADGLFAGPELAGHPDQEGHPGANWLMYGPWASDGVRDVITGDMELALGMTVPFDARQAAADGNQWIFDDIGSRFAAFVELYEGNPHPTDDELEQFFDDTFDDGDGTVQTGFAAYVAALDATDPNRRQELMFQGNLLVGIHEQAGVQPYLDAFTNRDHLKLQAIAMGLPPGTIDMFVNDPFLDTFATGGFVELKIGDDTLEVSEDVPDRSGVNNLIVPRDYLSFDPGGLTPSDFGLYGVSDLQGIEAFQPDFTQSLSEIWEDGRRTPVNPPNLPGPLLGLWGLFNDPPPVPENPESTEGSGARSWADWEQRMNYIGRLFEQYHTDPELFDTSPIDAGLDGVTWLDDDARPGG